MLKPFKITIIPMTSNVVKVMVEALTETKEVLIGVTRPISKDQIRSGIDRLLADLEASRTNVPEGSSLQEITPQEAHKYVDKGTSSHDRND